MSKKIDLIGILLVFTYMLKYNISRIFSTNVKMIIVKVISLHERGIIMSQYLTFVLDQEYYGIDISSVIEIIGMQKITQMPQQPDYVNGVINLRGRIIPTIDVRTRFKKERVEYDERTCIIVVDVRETMIGFIVDRVDEVLTIAPESISEPPRFNQDFKGRYVKGIARIDETIIMLLESSLLLSEEELEEAQSIKDEQ